MWGLNLGGGVRGGWGSSSLLPVAPNITTTSVSQGTENTPVSVQFAVSGDQGGRWYLVSGSLPTGVTFSSTGLLAGTPTTHAIYSFTVRYIDQYGQSDDQAITWTVIDDFDLDATLNAFQLRMTFREADVTKDGGDNVSVVVNRGTGDLSLRVGNTAPVWSATQIGAFPGLSFDSGSAMSLDMKKANGVGNGVMSQVATVSEWFEILVVNPVRSSTDSATPANNEAMTGDSGSSRHYTYIRDGAADKIGSGYLDSGVAVEAQEIAATLNTWMVIAQWLKSGVHYISINGGTPVSSAGADALSVANMIVIGRNANLVYSTFDVVDWVRGKTVPADVATLCQNIKTAYGI